jgi:hypothetical protein
MSAVPHSRKSLSEIRFESFSSEFFLVSGFFPGNLRADVLVLYSGPPEVIDT